MIPLAAPWDDLATLSPGNRRRRAAVVANMKQREQERARWAPAKAEFIRRPQRTNRVR